MSKRDEFRTELTDLINRYSLENGSNTPDWILAEHLTRCLELFNNTLVSREAWYGRRIGIKDCFAPPIIPTEPSLLEAKS